MFSSVLMFVISDLQSWSLSAWSAEVSWRPGSFHPDSALLPLPRLDVLMPCLGLALTRPLPQSGCYGLGLVSSALPWLETSETPKLHTFVLTPSSNSSFFLFHIRVSDLAAAESICISVSNKKIKNVILFYVIMLSTKWTWFYVCFAWVSNISVSCFASITSNLPVPCVDQQYLSCIALATTSWKLPRLHTAFWHWRW